MQPQTQSVGRIQPVGTVDALVVAAGWASGPFTTEHAIISLQSDALLPIFCRHMQRSSDEYFAGGRIEEAVTALRYKLIGERVQQERTSSPNA